MRKTSHRLIGCISVFAGLASLTLPAAPVLAQAKDSNLESAEGLFTLAISETADTPISRARNGSQIFTALRLSHDSSIVPIYQYLRQSKVPENQVFGMISVVLVSKDSSLLDVSALLNVGDPALIGSALASLIDADMITNEQLAKILAEGTDPVHRVMAAGELNRRKALKDRAPLKILLGNNKEIVRHYAAITMLTQKDEAENATALAALNEMAASHEPRIAPIQAILLLKVEKENLPLTAPWVTLIASDEQNDEGLRQTAISTLLAIKGADGPRIFSDLVANQKDSIQQIKLGLIALEHADRLKPAQIEPLTHSKSPLARSIATIAISAAEGNDVTADVVKLIREGHPLVMDWSVAYSDHCDPDRRMAIRNTIIGMSTIVDENRGRDFERAVLATQKILEDTAPGNRKAIEVDLKSDNRAVVEAVLAGIVRSSAEKPSDLVLPIWDSVSKSTATETSANYAALILARDGRKEALAWLGGMIQGGKVQNIGFRALAGWQYAKLTNQSDVLLKHVLPEKK